jgi:hypothetical protein
MVTVMGHINSIALAMYTCLLTMALHSLLASVAMSHGRQVPCCSACEVLLLLLLLQCAPACLSQCLALSPGQLAAATTTTPARLHVAAALSQGSSQLGATATGQVASVGCHQLRYVLHVSLLVLALPCSHLPV